MHKLSAIVCLTWMLHVNGQQVRLNSPVNPDFSISDGSVAPVGIVTIVSGPTQVDPKFDTDSPTYRVEDEQTVLDFTVSDAAELTDFSSTQEGIQLKTVVASSGRYTLHMTCQTDRPKDLIITSSVTSKDGKSTTFSFIKECLQSGPFLKDLLIYTTEGDPANVRGKTSPEFTLFDDSGPLKVVDSSTGSTKFSFTSADKQYWLGKPYVVVRDMQNPDEDLPPLMQGQSYFAQLMKENGVDIAKDHPITVSGKVMSQVLRTSLTGEVSGRDRNVFLVNQHNQLSFEFNKGGAFDALTHGQYLTVDYHCIANGMSLVQLVVPIPFNDQDGNTINSRIVRMSWIKVCKVGEFETEDKEKVSLAGLQVFLGTKAEGTDAFFAVQNGLPTTWFAKHQPQITSPMEQSSNRFFVAFDPAVVHAVAPPSQPRELYLTDVKFGRLERSSPIASCPGAISETGTCLIPVVDIDLHPDTAVGHAISTTPIPVEIVYHCIRPGRSLVMLQFEFGSSPTKSEHVISFSWDKICNGAPLTALDITISNPSWFQPRGSLYTNEEQTSSVASYRKKYPYLGKPVFRGGETLAAFSEHASSSVAFDLKMQENVAVFQIASSKNYPGTDVPIHSSIKLGNPRIHSSGTGCTANAYFLNTNNTAFASEALDNVSSKEFRKAMEHREVKYGAPTFLKVVHKCAVGGSAKLELVVPVIGGQELHIFWNKECGWVSTHGISVQFAGVVSMLSFTVAFGLMAIFLFRLNRKHRRLVAHAKYHKVPLDEFDDVLDEHDTLINRKQRMERA